MKFDYYAFLRNACKERYWTFVQTFWHVIVPAPMVANWHMPYLSDEIQTCISRMMRGETREYDLLVNIAPATSKSSLFSIFLTPWMWSIDPSTRMIGASFTEGLALELAGKSRIIVESPLYQKLFPEVVLRGDTNNKSHFATSKMGDRYAVATGGNVMGKHAGAIVIDDPLDPEGGRSKAEVDSVTNWCKETIGTRKVNQDTSVTMVVMQRIAENDPSALYKARGDVKHICMPAYVTDDISPPELVAYYKEDLFDPIRLPRRVLDEKLISMGNYAFSGQMLQNPIPLGGGMFKVDLLNVVQNRPPDSEFRKIVRFWDKAATKNGGDYTVGVLLGLHKDGSFWILNIVRGQWDSDTREKVIRSTAEKDGKRVLIGIEKEPGSAGVDSAKETIKRLHGYNVTAYPATGKKELRADTFSVQVNAGNVYIVDGPYVPEAKQEMAHFPHSKHDDQIDGMSGAFSMLDKNKPRLRTLGTL